MSSCLLAFLLLFFSDLIFFPLIVSCNLAIFHYDTTQENCFHLRCPTAESCVLRHRGNVVLYNITKGEYELNAGVPLRGVMYDYEQSILIHRGQLALQKHVGITVQPDPIRRLQPK